MKLNDNKIKQIRKDTPMFAYEVKATVFNRVKKAGSDGYTIPAQYNKVYTVRALELQKEKLVVNTAKGFVLTKNGRENFEKELARIVEESSKLAHTRQSYVGDKKSTKTTKKIEKSALPAESKSDESAPAEKSSKSKKSNKKNERKSKVKPGTVICTDPSEVAAAKKQLAEEMNNEPEPTVEDIQTTEVPVLTSLESAEEILEENEATA